MRIKSGDLRKYLTQGQTHSKHSVYIRYYSFKCRFNAAVPNDVFSLNLGNSFNNGNRNN